MCGESPSSSRELGTARKPRLGLRHHVLEGRGVERLPALRAVPLFALQLVLKLQDGLPPLLLRAIARTVPDSALVDLPLHLVHGLHRTSLVALKLHSMSSRRFVSWSSLCGCASL